MYKKILLATLVLCSSALTGCVAPESETNDILVVDPLEPFGKIKVKSHGRNATNDLFIVDASIPIEEVQIRDPNKGGYYVFKDLSFDLNLMQASKAVVQVLSRAKLPLDGSYDQIRFITSGDGRVELSDGRVVPLRVPSGAQSGLKVFFDQPITLSQVGITQIELDFDLSRSFHAIPGSNCVHNIDLFNLRPAIHASISVIEIEQPPVPAAEEAGSGEAGSGEVGSGEVGSGEVGSGEAGSGEAGSGEAGSGDSEVIIDDSGNGTIDYPVIPDLGVLGV